MRIQQNLILLFLITILISAIFGLNTLNIISSPITEENSDIGRELKVSNSYHNQKRANIKIVWEVISQKEEDIKNSRNTMAKIINDFPQDVYLGLRVFGSYQHSTANYFMKVPLAQKNKQQLLELVKQATPTLHSPTRINLIRAGESLSEQQGKKHILLVTDGNNNEQQSLTKTIQYLKNKEIRTHILQVGDVNSTDQLYLRSLAEIGNGKYFMHSEKDSVVPTINLN
ncbi:vWA domain-containing protein [Natroniella sp. ANB-PHB2]|uniref:vWA domain-containing protein n=1 Tax=Natroniella sp. ANB-PHB2 TaxID=3384444 RepID=UPI0038D3CF9B